jgi:hypothetical protein
MRRDIEADTRGVQRLKHYKCKARKLRISGKTPEARKRQGKSLHHRAHWEHDLNSLISDFRTVRQ